jgi:hypothetical protein
MLYTPTPYQVQSLHYGDAREPVAQIIPADAKRPTTLWRIRWPDGRLSDPVNRARAKDAAVALAVRGPPHRNPSRFRWRQDRSESPRRGRGRVSPPDPMLADARSQPNFWKAERAWRVVAGPEVTEANFRIPLEAGIVARQKRDRLAVEDHLRKAKRAAARKAMRAVPLLDPDRVPAVLHPSAPIPADGDPFEIPSFLDRCRLELEAAA